MHTDTETDTTTEVAAIRRVDTELLAALNARDIDRWLSHFAADAKLLPPGSTPVEGRDAIARFIAGLLTIPKFEMTQYGHEVQVSKAGDMAWVTYGHELTIGDSMGRPAREAAKNLTIYRKESGRWKVAVDMWNDDAPRA